ncbi:hypothetical protein [Nonomuraea sp. NPDC050310]|uniref:hypothetical protein n=1 Tax=Nonomuraea sp. NPDC050310 TaxID=3154935 RepID=UPI0033F5FC60
MMTRRSYTSTGHKRTEEPLGFELDGVAWECEAQMSLLDFSEFARLAVQGVDSESAEGLAILAELYQGLLGSSYQRFRAHCRKHGTSGEQLMLIVQDLAGDAAARPTERPSDSTDGPLPEAGTARVVSFSRGTVEEKPQEETPQVVSYG